MEERSMKHQGFLVLALTLLAGLVFGLAKVEPVAAGSNGQQLKVNVGCTWGSVTITGRNQYGSIATWRATNSSFLPCTRLTVSTTGWWWVGPVTISRTVPNKTCVVNVPRYQIGDWVNASCW